jgi:hypothetical protein
VWLIAVTARVPNPRQHDAVFLAPQGRYYLTKEFPSSVAGPILEGVLASTKRLVAA